MNERISFLYKKFEYLRNERLTVNSISKHQSRGTHNNLLENVVLVGQHS